MNLTTERMTLRTFKSQDLRDLLGFIKMKRFVNTCYMSHGMIVLLLSY